MLARSCDTVAGTGKRTGNGTGRRTFWFRASTGVLDAETFPATSVGLRGGAIWVSSAWR